MKIPKVVKSIRFDPRDIKRAEELDIDIQQSARNGLIESIVEKELCGSLEYGSKRKLNFVHASKLDKSRKTKKWT